MLLALGRSVSRSLCLFLCSVTLLVSSVPFSGPAPRLCFHLSLALSVRSHKRQDQVLLFRQGNGRSDCGWGIYSVTQARIADCCSEILQFRHGSCASACVHQRPDNMVACRHFVVNPLQRPDCPHNSLHRGLSLAVLLLPCGLTASRGMFLAWTISALANFRQRVLRANFGSSLEWWGGGGE